MEYHSFLYEYKYIIGEIEEFPSPYGVSFILMLSR